MEIEIIHTKEERASIVIRIDASKRFLPNYSAFGDDNWNAIDLQVKVIKEGINDIDKVMDLSHKDDGAQSAAIGAYYWLIGEEGEDALIIETN